MTTIMKELEAEKQRCKYKSKKDPGRCLLHPPREGHYELCDVTRPDCCLKI